MPPEAESGVLVRLRSAIAIQTFSWTFSGAGVGPRSESALYLHPVTPKRVFGFQGPKWDPNKHQRHHTCHACCGERGPIWDPEIQKDTGEWF